MKNFQIIISRFLLILASATGAAPAVAQDHVQKADVVRTDTREKAAVKKVLFIGDSMTGWLSERLNAYGSSNGFEVATVVWDGSTIRKWAETPRLKQIVDQQNPDAVFVSLGMNELFEKNPDTRLKSSVDKIKKAIGDRKLVWVGPPSWPGHKDGKTLDDWLAGQIGEGSYFSSLGLDLPRQSAKNPHPSKQGIIKWVDSLVDWLPQSNLGMNLQPAGDKQMVRGKTFIYKRMKESL